MGGRDAGNKEEEKVREERRKKVRKEREGGKEGRKEGRTELSNTELTPNKSNLALTRTNFPFPLGHFLYNFTLDNSNSITQTFFNFL